MYSRTLMTLTVENISFHAFYKRCGSQRDLKPFSSCLTLQIRLIFFLHIFALCKSYKYLKYYCASCLQPHSYQNLYWYPLTRWWMHPFNLPLLAPAYIPMPPTM